MEDSISYVILCGCGPPHRYVERLGYIGLETSSLNIAFRRFAQIARSGGCARLISYRPHTRRGAGL